MLTLREIETLARSLMREHEVDVPFVWDNARARAGSVHYRRVGYGQPYEPTRLTLSRVVVPAMTLEVARDTILHEIAHYKAGPRAGHGWQWRAIARDIGCTSDRCYAVTDAITEAVDAPWVGACPRGHKHPRHRQPVRVQSCDRCSRGFSYASIFTWTLYGRSVPEREMHWRYQRELASLRTKYGSGAPATSAVTPQPAPRVPDLVAASTPSVRYAVKTRVRVTALGQYRGAEGTIEKVGRSRYHVRGIDPRGLVTVPFQMVERVG